LRCHTGREPEDLPKELVNLIQRPRRVGGEPSVPSQGEECRRQVVEDVFDVPTSSGDSPFGFLRISQCEEVPRGSGGELPRGAHALTASSAIDEITGVNERASVAIAELAEPETQTTAGEVHIERGCLQSDGVEHRVGIAHLEPPPTSGTQVYGWCSLCMCIWLLSYSCNGYFGD